MRMYHRGPASCMIQNQGSTFLIDAGQPNLSHRFFVDPIAAILLTHYHMDHVHGLFPLRWGLGQKIQVLGPDDKQGCDDLYKNPGLLDFSKKSIPYVPYMIGEVEVTPLALNHSRQTLGYLCKQGNASYAYLCDTSGLPERTLAFLKADPPQVLALDTTYGPAAKRPKNHNDLNETLRLFHAIQPKKLYLTHLDHQFDRWLIQNPDALPDGMETAYDQLSFELR